jgi:hypothetical protein
MLRPITAADKRVFYVIGIGDVIIESQMVSPPLR